ncbi:hypothetical protein SAZ11_48825 [Streptomyces sp. FXJ1.4098]|nr:hypothetical protein [Streptomyces sp. FXJ1.4098]
MFAGFQRGDDGLGVEPWRSDVDDDLDGVVVEQFVGVAPGGMAYSDAACFARASSTSATRTTSSSGKLRRPST